MLELLDRILTYHGRITRPIMLELLTDLGSVAAEILTVLSQFSMTSSSPLSVYTYMYMHMSVYIHFLLTSLYH